jgi:hypothetical protein
MECKYAVPALLRAGGGWIINTASFVAVMGAARERQSPAIPSGKRVVSGPGQRRPEPTGSNECLGSEELREDLLAPGPGEGIERLHEEPGTRRVDLGPNLESGASRHAESLLRTRSASLRAE